MIPPETVIGPPRVLAELFAQRCAGQAATAVVERGRFSMVLPGGSVAREFLPVLADAPIDWSRADVFWADERAVPPDDESSNAGLAARLLARHATFQTARLHPMRGDAGDLEAAAQEYGRLLERRLGRPPMADVVLLGVGEDGHVASLFPGMSPTDDDGWVAVVRHAPKPPPRRITLTMSVLAAGRFVCLAAFGASKAAAMARALSHGDAAPSPAQTLLRLAHEPLVLLDAEAASQLHAAG